MNKYENGKVIPMTAEEEQALFTDSIIESSEQDRALKLAEGLSNATTIKSINSVAKRVLEDG